MWIIGLIVSFLGWGFSSSGDCYTIDYAHVDAPYHHCLHTNAKANMRTTRSAPNVNPYAGFNTPSNGGAFVDIVAGPKVGE